MGLEAGTIDAGMATVRLPAADFGGPMTTWPSTSDADRRTLTVPSSRSTSARVSARSSPHRRLVDAPSSTKADHRAGIASARASTWAAVATGRSAVGSLPAPLIRHALRRINSSSTAVFRIERRTR